MMTQSSLCTDTWLLGFCGGEGRHVSHIRKGRDRGRRIKRVTATLEGGRLHNRLFDCMQRVYAPHRITLCIGDRGSSNA